MDRPSNDELAAAMRSFQHNPETPQETCKRLVGALLNDCDDLFDHGAVADKETVIAPPQNKVCPTCKGKGTEWYGMMGPRKCFTCKGTGTVVKK